MVIYALLNLDPGRAEGPHSFSAEQDTEFFLATSFLLVILLVLCIWIRNFLASKNAQKVFQRGTVHFRLADYLGDR